MTRYIRYGALLGAMLVSVGCGDSTAPEDSDVLPKPEYIPVAQTPSLTTTFTGVAWDPESFFYQVTLCGADCPMPPYLSEGLPLYLNASVSGAAVRAFDPLLAGPPPANPMVGEPGSSDELGIWVVKGVPAPATPRPVPMLMFNAGVGSLPPVQIGPPFPKLDPGPVDYVPTLTLRPITVGNNSSCTGLEATQISQVGILEAVAKHLTATGTDTQVADLINPARYQGVFVLWAYEAGIPVRRTAADGISLEHSVGQKLSLSWKFPGTGAPEENQSTRGFYVTPGEEISNIGLYVVLVPQGPGLPPVATFRLADTKTDEVSLRPWFFPEVTVGIGPGVVAFGGFQMFYPLPPVPPPPGVCVFQ